MLDFLVFAAEHASADHGGSKTAFYVAGLVLAGVAVLVAALGIARPTFAEREGAARTVIGGVFLLVVATLAAVIATS